MLDSSRRAARRGRRPRLAAALLGLAAAIEIAHTASGQVYPSLTTVGSVVPSLVVIAVLVLATIGLALRTVWGWHAGFYAAIACVGHGAVVSILPSRLGPLFLVLGAIAGVLVARSLPRRDPTTGRPRWSWA
jgi:hypothetical protein